MDIDKAIEWEQEKAARRAAWEDERKAEAERREREEKQGRFEAWRTTWPSEPPSKN